jgi:hypothetical protein
VEQRVSQFSARVAKENLIQIRSHLPRKMAIMCINLIKSCTSLPPPGILIIYLPGEKTELYDYASFISAELFA